MFGQLAMEMHKKNASRDHNKIIVEAADEVIPVGEDGGDDISMSELDQVIANDADAVTQEELDSLEALVGQVAEKEGTDITKMTTEEIEKHVNSVPTPSLLELNS